MKGVLKHGLTMGLAMAIALGGIACGTSEPASGSKDAAQSDNSSNSSKDSQAAPDALDEDIVTIQMAYFCESGIPKDLLEVQEAINEITREEIHVEVNLNVFESGNYAQQLSLMLNSGEALDLAVTFPAGASNFSTLKSQNLILPMKSLLEEYAPEALELMGDGLVGGTTIDGEVYGLTINNDKALSLYWLARKDILEKYDLLDQAQQANSFSDLAEIFQVVKDNEPTLAPVINSASYHIINSVSLYFGDTFDDVTYMDVLGDTSLMMAGIQTENPEEIINVYESDTYKEMLSLMEEWYSKGYIYKDATMSEESPEQLVRTNVGFSWFGTANPSEIVSKSESAGYELFALELAPCMINAGNSRNFVWFVPVASKEPEAAVKFMNLFYTDERVINLFNYGIKDKHYVLNENQTVSLPEGKTAENVGYYTTSDFLFGTVFLAYPREGLDPDYRQQRWEANKNAIHSPSSGFSFDSSGLENEITALTNVVLEYCPALETGSCDDMEAAYEAFISKLEASGAQDLLTAYQEQYAAFHSE